jgi:alpha,alpha-trehalase
MPCASLPRLSILAVMVSAATFPHSSIAQPPPQEAAAPTTEKPKPILDYISGGWDTLTRSMTNCSTVVDTKLATVSVLYVPADFKVPDALREMEKSCGLEIRALPKVIQKPGEMNTNLFSPHGLLYLPNSYVVPGGRFNEMYGWDSYFIIRGLVRSGRTELARGMVENFFFEIDHYGSILNANRTYYLSRSQPPFLTSMIFSVYNAQKEKGNEDRAWLERAYAYAVRDHDMWVQEPLLAGTTGLSRYYDFGEGPAPESLKDEQDHYRKVIDYFLSHYDTGRAYLDERNPGEDKKLGPGTEYALRLCDMPKTMERPHCEPIRELSLTRDYYKGDRAMRESGFDISFRFGPFGADTHHFAPICLNSLLYKTEIELAEMSEILGHKADAENWKKRAAKRQDDINKFLWDAQRGQFFDYDTAKQVRSTYEYITTYYPLFAGLATTEQAKSLIANLKNFEQPGGAVMSPYTTGAQWDSPYAWAPTQMILVDGLRKYGFKDEADRISYKFAGTVADNYAKQGYIVEKYNAIDRSTDSATSSGYQINVIGFGWTNAAFLDFLQGLPGAKRAELSKAAH